MPLQRDLRLVRLAVAAELRNPAIRLLGVIGALSVGAYAWTQGPLAGSVAVVLVDWLGRAYGVGACLWFAYAAIRDLKENSGAVLRSKPVDGAEWVLVNWAAGLAVWLILLGAAFLAAALAQMAHAPAASIASHLLGFARAALIVASMGTLSFAISRMMRSPLGGILVMFAWFCAMAGLQYIPQYLLPDLAQNAVLYAPAALALLVVAGLLVERFRRGELRRPALGVLLAASLLGLAGAGAARAYSVLPRAETEIPNFWEQIRLQHIQEGQRAPGFWLPDGKGGIVRTADHRGKILLIYLFAADDMEAARTLPALETVARQFEEVQPIGVCISTDHGDGWVLSRAGGYSFPIGIEVTATRVSGSPSSAVASAYDVDILPTLAVTDRYSRVRRVATDSSYDVSDLTRLVQERLAE